MQHNNSREKVAEVLAATDIVDLIGAAIELKPAGGGRLKALCPFHTEKTPSFIVSRDRQTFHCFGCQKGGDALSFTMEMEGLTFPEALRKLADRAGIDLPKYAGGGNDKEAASRRRLQEFGRFARSFFIEQLNEPMRGGAGRHYLKSRALSDAVLSRFGVGFAPPGWDNLLNAAKRREFDERALEASGMVRRGERGGMYDFFRNRVVFPIRDLAGEVVAFGGRDITGEEAAKYINSPETAVYKKSRVLYGLYEAREALRRERVAVLVEGYFDLLRCVDAGVENVVATCGTALTAEQAALLRRYAPEVVLVYDGDAAGVQAALKGATVLTAAGLTVRALCLPDNQDPDDFIRDAGGAAFQALVAEAADIVGFYAAMSQERLRTIEGRTEVARELFALIRGIDDAVRTDEYVKRVAEALGLNPWACRREYENHVRDANQRGRGRAADTAEAPPPVNRDDRDFVAALLSYDALRATARERMENIPVPEGPLGEILGPLLAGETANLGRAIETDAARRLYTAAANSDAPDLETARGLVGKRLNRLEQQGLRAEVETLREAIQQAEADRDNERLTSLLARQVQLAGRIERVGAA